MLDEGTEVGMSLWNRLLSDSIDDETGDPDSEEKTETELDSNEDDAV